MHYNHEYRAEVQTGEQLAQALSDADYKMIYAPMRLLIKSEISENDRIVAVPPVFLGGDEREILLTLSELRQRGFKSALAHTLGHIELIKKARLVPRGGMRLNITNSRSMAVYEKLGLADCVFSAELMIKQSEAIRYNIPAGIIAYGRLPLMLTRRCPAADSISSVNNRKGGIKCRADSRESVKNCEITDRLGNKFPLLCGNAVEILNADVLVLSDKTDDLKKFDFIVLRFTDEEDINSVKALYENGTKPDGRFTRGLYYRGVD